VRIYCTLLDSPAWRVLGWSARALFIDLRSQVGATNNGNLEATMKRLKHYGWTSATTLAGALYELQALGFIAKTRAGGIGRGGKICSLYRFTDLQTFAFPKLGVAATNASHEYREFASVDTARRALEEGVQQLRDQAKARTFPKNKLQKLERSDPETGAETPEKRSRNWTSEGAIAPDSGQVETHPNRPETRASKRSTKSEAVKC